MKRTVKAAPKEVDSGLEYSDFERDEFPSCCGITIFHAFPFMDEFEGTRADLLRDFIKMVGTPRRHLNMIALTDDQLKDGWLSIIRDAGFRRACRFRNGEHGNVVNVYHQVRNEDVPAYKK